VPRRIVGRKRDERDHSEDSGVDEAIILKWMFLTWDGGRGLDRSGSG
jgi:hypothetical protein